VEVINSSRSNESGEHATSDTELISNRGEAEVHMQILLHFLEEESKEIIRSIEEAISFGFTSYLSLNGLKLILSKELGNITSGKNIIDIHKESVVNDLTISENKHKVKSLGTRLHESSLDIGLKIRHAVVGRDNNSVGILSQNVSSKLGKRLLSRTTDTDK